MPNLSGGTLKLQQDQRTGTLHDVEVEQQGLLPDYPDRLSQEKLTVMSEIHLI